MNKYEPLRLSEAATVAKLKRAAFDEAIKHGRITWKYRNGRRYTTIAWIEEQRHGK